MTENNDTITLPFQPRITNEDVKKAFNRLVTQYGMARKGYSQMSDAKRAELRKKRKNKKKK